MYAYAALVLAVSSFFLASCKKDKDKDEGDATGETGDAIEALRIEGTWQDVAALEMTEAPTSLLCMTVESAPKTCKLPISVKAFAGTCPGFAGIEFACFPQTGAQIVGFTKFETPLPAYGIGTLVIDVKYDAVAYEATATVNAAKTTAPAGAAADRTSTALPDLRGAWEFAANPDLAEGWTVDAGAQTLHFEAPAADATISTWGSNGARVACSEADAATPLFLRQGDEMLPLRVDTLAHLDADLDAWFGSLSDDLKGRLRRMTRYAGRYGSLPPCEVAGDCGTGDFATLGPRDVQRLRDALATTLFDDPAAISTAATECAAHTVPKNFNFKMCGPSQLRACDVVKLGLDAPLGLEIGDDGHLETGEPPGGTRFDASYEWLCPQAYADHRTDDDEGATDVLAALMACRGEFLAAAPTAYKQALVLEDWYNLESHEYVLLCSATGPTKEQQDLALDLAASCTPELWRQANCVDDECTATLSCPYAREDGKCVDQDKFVGNVRGRKPALTVTAATGGAFVLASDVSATAKQTIEGVTLDCQRWQHQRIFAVSEPDGRLTGFFVDVLAGGCAGPDDVDAPPATGTLFPFVATRL
jgi:hypothetical protein